MWFFKALFLFIGILFFKTAWAFPFPGDAVELFGGTGRRENIDVRRSFDLKMPPSSEIVLDQTDFFSKKISLADLNPYLAAGGKVLIAATLSDSFEALILEEMRKSPEWHRVLEEIEFKGFEDWRREAILLGFEISYADARRGLAEFENIGAMKKWICSSIVLSRCATESEAEKFAEEFIMRAEFLELFPCSNGRVLFPYKQLIMLVLKPKNNEASSGRKS